MSETDICNICDVLVQESEDGLLCEKCFIWKHRTCLSMSERAYNCISKSSQPWFCEDCKECDATKKKLTSGKKYTLDDVMGKLNEMDKRYNLLFMKLEEQVRVTEEIKKEVKRIKENELTRLDSELVVVRKDITALKQLSSTKINDGDNQHINNQAVLREVQNRAERSNNLMFYNIPESKSNDVKVRVDHDIKLISETLHKLDVAVANFKAIRIGRNVRNDQMQDKPRPVKVFLKNSQLVSDCLRNKWKLKDALIKINSDLTKSQRDKYSLLKKQLNRRISEGENNLVIRFTLGDPYITSSKPKGTPKH
nr:unnamed protein product [Callosobruchus analis]